MDPHIISTLNESGGLVLVLLAGMGCGLVAFGYDSTTTPTGVYQATTNAANYITGHSASHTHRPGIGRHYYAWLEYSTATGACTWYGDNGSNVMQSGIVGTFDA